MGRGWKKDVEKRRGDRGKWWHEKTPRVALCLAYAGSIYIDSHLSIPKKLAWESFFGG